MAGSYIRFDWAMKRLLRNKANFGVLEGLLTTLLNRQVRIEQVVDTEPYADDDICEGFRVDLLITNAENEQAWVEIQNNNEYTYYQRTIFGLSKKLTHIVNQGNKDGQPHKVYSVNIVYFPLGHGTDTVYHGKTEFRGIHNGELLELSPFQKQTFKMDEVSQLYPEYYILKVNDFNRVAKTPLEEWIYYLNTGDVPEGASAPGLKEVKERLKLDRMTKDELNAYYRHLDNIVILRDNIFTERAEGRAEGLAEVRAEGLAEGLAEGRAEGLAEGFDKANRQNARSMKAKGIPASLIAEITGLSVQEIDDLD